ncbi:MAG: aldo/keto reductase [Deltaproteobacteria bacterium]|nr:aldo/keto reductase [Nannocystaceae bacterium]
MTRAFEVHGVAVPPMLYGTAWKEDATAELVRLALASGFVGIDTANQRKHYFEAGVGEAIAGMPRERLFLQTKFTYARGQDARLPYDPNASLTTQVEQSFASSLEHLGVQHIDAYVLHGPHAGRGWTDLDREVWRAMEGLHQAGHVRLLGVSNISREQLETLVDEASVPPSLVQNRCYARTGWDREVRALCRDRGLLYEGFSLLTANRTELGRPAVAAIARRAGATIPQVVFRFAEAIGIVALTGTSDRAHMHEDLAAHAIVLAPADVAIIEAARA